MMSSPWGRSSGRLGCQVPPRSSHSTHTGANERFTSAANLRHAPGVNPSTGPVRSLESRTSTRDAWSATSMHSAPPLELYDALRHFRFALSIVPLPFV